MSKATDPNYLLSDQYQDASNLDARVQLHLRFSTNKLGWNRWCFNQLDLPPDARVLELGSGPGYLWRDNLERIPAGWNVTLSDFSPGMLDEARRSLASNRHTFRFQQSDARAIPWKDNAGDAVIANYMLHYVPDRLQALSEMQRVLKPGGKVYLGANGPAHLRELHELVQRFDPYTDFGWDAASDDLFSLDNGSIETELYFQAVEVRRYEDALVVTEAGPLVDYILSMSSTEPARTHRAELRDFIARELLVTGAIQITKDSGMLMGVKSSLGGDSSIAEFDDEL